jgi:hypothetical protein
MKITQEKLHELLGPAIQADPAVLEIQFTEDVESVSDRECLCAALRVLGASVQSLVLLAKEIDDLRATTAHD